MSCSPFRPVHRSFAEKKLIVEEYFTDAYRGSGMTAKEFSGICGVPYATLHAWMRRIDWDPANIEQLRRTTRSRVESGGSTLPPSIREAIVSLKSEYPSWGPLKIRQYLFRHEQVLIPHGSIYRFLKQEGLVQVRRAADSESASKRPVGFEYPSPLAAVQMDLLHVVLSSGAKIYLVTLLDDFSRFVLASRFVPVKTMDAAIEVAREAIRAHGVMERLLTDHGSEFVSWQRFTRFEQLLADLEIEYIPSGPSKPENQGKIERWHQTVRQALRERGPLDCSSEAQLWIGRLTDHYNHERPHQALGGLVPADRFYGVDEALSSELEQYRSGRRADRCVYVACRVGGRNVIVSGPRADAMSILVDGVRVGAGSPPMPGRNALRAGRLDPEAPSRAEGTDADEAVDEPE